MKLSKDKIEGAIREFIDEDKEDTFNDFVLRFSIAFKEYREEENPLVLANRTQKEYESLEGDIEENIQEYKEKLDYDEWGLALIYAASVAQVKREVPIDEDEKEDLSYIG